MERLKGSRNTDPDHVKDGNITTSKGRFYNVEKLDLDLIDAEFIFTSISTKARYNGNTVNKSGERYLWSTLQHSILGAQTLLVMGKPKEALTYLFHDSIDSLFADILSPIKIKYPEIKEIEKKIESQIFDKLTSLYPDIIFPFPPIIKQIDVNIIEFEMENFLFQDECAVQVMTPDEAVMYANRLLKLILKFIGLQNKELLTKEWSHAKKEE